MQVNIYYEDLTNTVVDDVYKVMFHSDNTLVLTKRLDDDKTIDYKFARKDFSFFAVYNDL